LGGEQNLPEYFFHLSQYDRFSWQTSRCKLDHWACCSWS